MPLARSLCQRARRRGPPSRQRDLVGLCSEALGSGGEAHGWLAAGARQVWSRGWLRDCAWTGSLAPAARTRATPARSRTPSCVPPACSSRTRITGSAAGTACCRCGCARAAACSVAGCNACTRTQEDAAAPRAARAADDRAGASNWVACETVAFRSKVTGPSMAARDASVSARPSTSYANARRASGFARVGGRGGVAAVGTGEKRGVTVAIVLRSLPPRAREACHAGSRLDAMTLQRTGGAGDARPRRRRQQCLPSQAAEAAVSATVATAAPTAPAALAVASCCCCSSTQQTRHELHMMSQTVDARTDAQTARAHSRRRFARRHHTVWANNIATASLTHPS